MNLNVFNNRLVLHLPLGGTWFKLLSLCSTDWFSYLDRTSWKIHPPTPKDIHRCSKKLREGKHKEMARVRFPILNMSKVKPGGSILDDVFC